MVVMDNKMESKYAGKTRSICDIVLLDCLTQTCKDYPEPPSPSLPAGLARMVNQFDTIMLIEYGNDM